jgi:hypothetical protein
MGDEIITNLPIIPSILLGINSADIIVFTSFHPRIYLVELIELSCILSLFPSLLVLNHSNVLLP